MKESRLPRYSMLGIRACYNWFDSGAAMTNVYNDSIKEGATSKLEFSNSISCVSSLHTYVMNRIKEDSL